MIIPELHNWLVEQVATERVHIRGRHQNVRGEQALGRVSAWNRTLEKLDELVGQRSIVPNPFTAYMLNEIHLSEVAADTQRRSGFVDSAIALEARSRSFRRALDEYLMMELERQE